MILPQFSEIFVRRPPFASIFFAQADKHIQHNLSENKTARILTYKNYLAKPYGTKNLKKLGRIVKIFGFSK